MAKIKLMTKELEKKIPNFNNTDTTPLKDRKIYAHYFHPLRNFHWFVYEYDKETQLFFGYAFLNNIDFAELGYFSLTEFEEINKQFPIGIERDRGFKPQPTDEAVQQYPMLTKIMNY